MILTVLGPPGSSWATAVRTPSGVHLRTFPAGSSQEIPADVEEAVRRAIRDHGLQHLVLSATTPLLAQRLPGTPLGRHPADSSFYVVTPDDAPPSDDPTAPTAPLTYDCSCGREFPSRGALDRHRDPIYGGCPLTPAHT